MTETDNAGKRAVDTVFGGAVPKGSDAPFSDPSAEYEGVDASDISSPFAAKTEAINIEVVMIKAKRKPSALFDTTHSSVLKTYYMIILQKAVKSNIFSLLNQTRLPKLIGSLIFIQTSDSFLAIACHITLILFYSGLPQLLTESPNKKGVREHTLL